MHTFLKREMRVRARARPPAREEVGELTINIPNQERSLTKAFIQLNFFDISLWYKQTLQSLQGPLCP